MNRILQARRTGRLDLRGRGLGARLLMAQGTVLAAGFVTAGLVAALVGPRFFHDHLLQAGVSGPTSGVDHIEQAYQDASLIALGVSLVIALVCALVVTWYMSGRIQEPLTLLTRAAREMGRGHYGARAHVVGAGPELSTLAAAFNGMAARLEATEETRRRLLSDLAHEVRTPVATIGAYLDGLDDGVVAWTPEVSALLRNQTDRLARLCGDLSEVSRAEEGGISVAASPHRVDDLVRAAGEAMRAQYAAKGVDLVVEPGPAPGAQVVVDPQRIGQVFANLLSNALRHTPPGGRVTLSVRDDGPAPRPGADGAPEVAVVVADTGDGMTADQLPRVFERFYRGDTARTRDSQGSGIGLTIAKAIADAHGGSIRVDSEGPGRGSTFTVMLPQARVSGAEARSQAAEAASG